jgi:HEAT repeat protein
MPTLSSSIVKQNVASVRDVEEALARQAMYGGDLTTNLLELSTVSEERLAQLLADSHQIPPAPFGELPRAPSEVLRLVPRELARRFGLYPLSADADVLRVAVGEPLPGEVESDLSFSLGLRIEQRIAVVVRVQQALARDYDVPLEQRTERVLARLAGKPDPNPSVVPPASPQPAPGVTRRAPQRIDGRAAAKASPIASAGVGVDLSALAKRERRPRRLGPYTAAMAERDLLAASNRDDVLRAFFDFSAQYFEYAVLFAVHGDLAEGRDAAGAGASRARVVSLGIPLDLPSALSRAASSDQLLLTRLSTSGLDGALARDLDRRPGPLALLLPVRVRGRTVLVLYGDHGDQDVELDSVGQVISFAPLVAHAVERLILRRKQRGGGETSITPPPVEVRPPFSPRTSTLPRPEQRAAALASALGAEDRSSPISAAPPTTQELPTRPLTTSPVPSTVTASDPPAPPRLSGFARPVISVGTKRAAAAESPLIAAAATAARAATPAPGSATAGDAPAAAAPREPMTEVKAHEEGWEETFRQRERGTEPGMGTAKLELVTQVSEPPRAPEPAAVSDASDAVAVNTTPAAAEASQQESLGDEAPEIAVGAEALDEELEPPPSSGVPLAPLSRSLAHSARPLPLPKSSEELRLPTVIVDLANDCRALLDQLLAGKPEAGDKLVEIGEPAVTVLASSFPGPITAELRRGVGTAPSKASECGPVLRTLARIGNRAVPVLVVRTADADPNVRAWATRLLGEMPCDEAARAVVRRFVDEEQEVRRAALAAGRLMQHHAEARSMVQIGLAELLADTSRPEEQRHALIEAIADLRDGRAVPTLLRLLDDRSNDIVRSAHWALVVLARQDLGHSPAAWDEWWRQNGSRHRIEWLIDALAHESAEIRRTAGDELKSTTKEYFGYYDDLPVNERIKAQTRYREWWEAKGKARFR